MKSRVLILLLFLSGNMFGQILHTESFAVILDTTKHIKGSVMPYFKFQNLKKDYIEFNNASDITFRFGQNAITFANKIELSKYGEDVLLSGGFLYIEYRKIMENRIVLEPFSQFHWSEVRGLEFKYAGGINLRYRFFRTEEAGLFAGIGPFYEIERWNWDGVRPELVPLNPEVAESESLKLGSYVSFKWKTGVNFDIDISLYHQGRLNELFYKPRLASSSSIKYNFTEHLGLILQYQNIYDYKPLVPVDKLYNQLACSLEVSF